MVKILLVGIVTLAVVLGLTAAIVAIAPYLAILIFLAIVGFMLWNQEESYSGEEDANPGKDKDSA